MDNCLLVREVAGILAVVSVLCCDKAQVVFCVCLRMHTGGSALPNVYGAACVGLGPSLWLEESWELREGKCCWREDCNCSCTLGAVTCCHLLPALVSAHCLSDGDAGLSAVLLSFPCDAEWRPHLRGCACVYLLSWMPG